MRFVRNVEADEAWRAQHHLKDLPPACALTALQEQGRLDAIVNFIGVGDPARAVALGAGILDLTRHYDEMVLAYLRRHPSCRYLFLSSGAAYGSDFERPATENTQASFPINNLDQRHWYGLAKFHAECRHRATPDLAIGDIRIFSYVSRSLDVGSRFLLADIVRALSNGRTLMTSAQDLTRDYVCPQDLFSLMWLMLTGDPANGAVDVYSQAPVGKMELLAHLGQRFGLRHALVDAPAGVNATGIKPNYFSENRKAAEFGYSPQFDSLTAVTSTVGHLICQP